MPTRRLVPVSFLQRLLRPHCLLRAYLLVLTALAGLAATALASPALINRAISQGDVSGDPRRLTPEEAEQRLATLHAEIVRHDTLYQQAASEISDFDYDRLKRSYAELARAFPELAKRLPPLPAIGDDRTGLFQPYRHRERMMSLDKTYAQADVRGFHARLSKLLGRDDHVYVVEPKYDGLAISVTFESGRLVRAVTRGNGAEGEDITANVLQIRGLPRSLASRTSDGQAHPIPAFIELRGEIHVPFGEFARVNAERDAAGAPRFANPRNLAAGTVRQRDAQAVAQRGLQVVFFGVGACEPAAARPATQRDLHVRLKAWGLPAPEGSMNLCARLMNSAAPGTGSLFRPTGRW